MELKTIQALGRWTDQAVGLNGNFNTINIEVEKIKASTVKFLGYFTLYESLISNHPNPIIGQTAWVGTPYPGVVYECRTVGVWTNTGDVPGAPEVNLNNWEQTDW